MSNKSAMSINANLQLAMDLRRTTILLRILQTPLQAMWGHTWGMIDTIRPVVKLTSRLDVANRR